MTDTKSGGDGMHRLLSRGQIQKWGKIIVGHTWKKG